MLEATAMLASVRQPDVLSHSCVASTKSRLVLVVVVVVANRALAPAVAALGAVADYAVKNLFGNYIVVPVVAVLAAVVGGAAAGSLAADASPVAAVALSGLPEA